MSPSPDEELLAQLQRARQRDIEDIARDLVRSLTLIGDRLENYAYSAAHIEVPFEVKASKGSGA
jgi:hypothetical protein